MIIPDSVYQQLAKDYKASSIKTFESSLTRIMKAVNPSYDGTQIFDEDSIERYFDLIHTYLESVDKSPLTYAFLKLVKILMPGSEYIGDLKELQEQQEVNKKMDYLQKKGEDEDFPFNWDELMEMQESLEKQVQKNKTDTRLNIKYLFMSLIKYVEPQRSEIYTSTFFTEKDTTIGNYINLNKGVWHIRNFKTDGIHEPIKIPLPNELMGIIKEVRNNIKSIYLIPRLDDVTGQQTSVSLNKFLKTFLLMSTSKIRSLYVTTMTARQEAINSQNMGHTANVSRLVYNKNVNDYVVRNGQLYFPAAKNEVIQIKDAIYIRKK